MKVEQIYTNCLAQGAYYIESNGEAAIIDPLREVQPYISMAEKRNAKIKYIFETHFHADFVSGHLDLSKKTGATIVYGPTSTKLGFDALIAADNQIFKLGNVCLRLIHTPGHTMESSCYLLTDETGKETAIFTGDTLFIGDVGRPDLAQQMKEDLSEEKLAGYLFESLHHKILPLSDDLIVYPAHGAGSACGKNMSKETQDTLGHQKQTNYALNTALSKDEFTKQVLSGLTPTPPYFPKNVLLNINGYDAVDEVIERGRKALSVKEFQQIAEETKALIIDTRTATNFRQGFVPNSINIGIDGSFAVWVGTVVLDIKQPILLVTETGREEEVITRLARVGYDNTLGFLEGGMEAWTNEGMETDTILSISAKEFAEEKAKNDSINILDVRKKSEFDTEHLKNAINAPLDFINNSMQLVDKTKTYFVHCAAGYRSMVFVSILKAKGFKNLIDIDGGFTAIKTNEN